jgi:gamma-glutamyltranspeptidase
MSLLSAADRQTRTASARRSGFKLKRLGERLRQPALGRTLQVLTEDGLDGFYRGALADVHARLLQETGSPLRLADFQVYCAEYAEPLSVGISARLRLTSMCDMRDHGQRLRCSAARSGWAPQISSERL